MNNINKSNSLCGIFNFVRQGVIFIETDTFRIKYCNSYLLENSKYSVDDLLGKQIQDLIHCENFNVSEVIKDAASSKMDALCSQKAKFVNKDKSELPVEVALYSLEDIEENTSAVLVSDLVEMDKMENLLIRNQKLETLNSIIGGIAHDFNNILTGIAMNVELTKNKIEPTDVIYNYLNSIEVEIKQSRKLTQQMQSFNEKSKPLKRIRSLRELLVDSISFTLRGTNVVSKFSNVKNLWFVNIDALQINQAISNIVMNAVQAMPSGGIVTVCVENVTIEENDESKYKPGQYVKLAIKDQGVGIDPEVIGKVFNKFYTTGSNRAGLGLTVAKSIIKNHEGYIEIDSELGTGTTVTVLLPAFEPSVAKQTQKNGKTKHVGKILIMDDESTIRNSLTSYLTELGYDVEGAQDGKEAIKLFTTAYLEEDGFNVAILDLTIPGGFGGKQTIKKLKQIDPDFKSIVTSGYTNDPILYDFKSYGFDNVILKPYDLKELELILESLLKTD